jgi:flagellar basal-body rod modification protein FlgD
MPSVSSITAGSTNPALIATGENAGSARVTQKTLGKDDFMKLLAVQFQMQDPMKPMDDTAFIAQTAQFTSLEHATSMAQDMAALRSEQQRVVANSYLGHRVTVDAGEDKSATGDVTAIDNTSGTPRLVVDGKPYALSAVLRVEPGVVSAPASALVTAGGA